MTTLSEPASDPTLTVNWRALHLWAEHSREQTDRVLLEVVAPLADRLQAAGDISRWFFIRYSEGGQHLRVRLDGATAETLASLAAGLADTGRVTVESYQPEVARYGGPDAIGLAEDVFCRSSQLALAGLRAAPSASHRMAAGIELILATAAGLGLDTVGAVAWLRGNAYSWRWQPAELTGRPAGALHNAALQAAITRAPAINRRWRAAQLDEHRGVAAAWSATVREALADRASAAVAAGRARVLGIWSSQLHMLLNRLGIGPDEERWLEWLIAASLERPDPAPGFFAADVLAADRAYLAGSRYVLSQMAEQQPQDELPPEPLLDWTPFAGRSVTLPAAPMTGSLQDALRNRRSGRGPYGPPEAAELGALLWNAAAPDGVRGVAGRAYPSAGGKLAARLRIAVLDVAGLAPGLYEVDPDRRQLLLLSPAPTPPDLAATSMWFRCGVAEPDHVDTRAVPAVLGLYLDLAAMRTRYGQRALRFALLEAGHLAQNLALVAAGTGVQLCTIGGIYDDLAHETYLLDGVDRVLSYLLPVGGRSPIR